MNVRSAHGRTLPRAFRVGSNLAFLMVLGLCAAQAAVAGKRSSATALPVVTVRAQALASQPTQVHYDPYTREVTIKASLPDTVNPVGGDIQQDSFLVYENGVRQHDVDVSVEHAPLSIGVLLEFGGRYRAVNETLGQHINAAARQLLDEIGPHDTVSVWTYGDHIEPLPTGLDDGTAHPLDPGLTTPHAIGLTSLGTPPFSESNLYDALQATLPRLQAMKGRKALIVVSTGLNTFSKARFQDVLQSVRAAGVPVYAINIGPALRSSLSVHGDSSPYARLNWARAQSQLARLAKESHGRVYVPQVGLDFAPVYDDLLAGLRVEYVIRYKSTVDDLTPRSVRVHLVGANGARELIAASQVTGNSPQSSQKDVRTGA